MQDLGEAITRDLDDCALEALIEVVYLAAFADGTFSDAEREHFTTSFLRLTDGRSEPPRPEIIVDSLRKKLETEGRQACLSSIRERLPTPNLRWLAVMLAADMTASDGIIHPSERKILLALAQILDVDIEEATKLVDGFE